MAISAIRASEATVEVFKTAAGKGLIGGALHIAKGLGQFVAPIFTQIKAIQAARLKDKDSGSSDTPDVPKPVGVGTSIVGNVAANNAARIGVDPSLSQGAEASAANRINAESSGNVVFSESRYTDFQRQVEFKEEKTTI